MASPVLQFKRGLSTNVGIASFKAGEPGFTTDKYDFYIGLDATAANQKFFGSARYWTRETGSAAAILKLVDKNGSNSTNLKAADTLAGIVTFTLPSADGTANQAIVTNGSGTLSFATVTTSAGTLTGAGAGVTTFLVTPTSANLAAALTDETGSGALVFANTPTLVTPVLGTPTSGTLTNCTGLPVSTGISGLGANVATFLATPTSANLASAITDETGTGALVFANTPTFSGGINASEGADLGRLRVTGISTLGQTNTTGLSNAGVSTLGNATASTVNVSGFSTFSGGASATLFRTVGITTLSDTTAATVNVSGFSTLSGGLSVPSGGANITGVVTATTFNGGLAVGNITGLAANVATFLATPSSANLISAVTDETGTGALVFANTPTLVTPVLGSATATSIVVGSATTITASGLTAGAAGIVTAATVNASNLKALDGTTAITITSGTGVVSTNSDLTVGGNLYVNGNTTQVNTSQMTVEDRTIELGIVDGAAPSTTTTWDLGVLFNYYDSSAKKSALIWEQGDARFKLGSVITDGGGTGVNNPQITFTTYAALEIGELWLNGACTGGSSQVIACSGSNLILQNITIDAGQF